MKPKSKTVAILLALFFGGIMLHRFYLGDSQTFVICFIIVILTGGIAGIFFAIFGVLEAISYLLMSRRSFDNLYLQHENTASK